MNRAETRMLSLLIICLLASYNTFCQQTPKRIDSGKYGYLEYLPPDYNTNTTKKYPLLIFLHGLGEKGNGTPSDLERVKAYGPPARINEGHNMCFEVDGVTECFIVISPQTPFDGWYYTITGEVLDHVLNGSDNYRVDENRIYLTGLSLGGIGTWEYVAWDGNSPNKLAAIAPVAGRGAGGCIVAAKDVAIWAFHGDQDNTIRYQDGLNAFLNVKNCTNPEPTAELIFTTYEGVGHNSWSRAYRVDNSLHTPNLYEWFLTKSLVNGPNVDAGADKIITLPTNTTNLTGTASDDGGTIVSYAWTKESGPAASLSNQNTSVLTVSNLVEGIYVFKLTATDNDGNTGSDLVQVTVNPAAVNNPPSINLGSNITLTLPTNSTNINATVSDTDGSVVSYAWTQSSGPSSATLSGAATATVTVSNLVEGTYVFRLTAVDDDGASSFKEISVIVNPAAVNNPPTVNVGNDQTINLPTNTTTINGNASDTDGTISSYLWEKMSGPTVTISNGTTATVTLTNLVEGTYVFRLTVSDDDGSTAFDEVSIIVVASNNNPNSNAGNDQSITLPTNSTTLNGSGSDSDGTITSYSWTQVSGPGAATIATPSNASTSVGNLIEGNYQFKLTVQDDDGATASDQVLVSVLAMPSNSPPVANAGEDISITLPTNNTIINGSGSDSDGTITSYQWSKISGPATFNLSGQTTSTLSVTNMVEGAYTFRLTVTDDDGATHADQVIVNVAPETVNQSPSANAGVDKNITLPTNSLVINGSGSDPDGTITSYSWNQQSGPNNATLTNNNTANVTASNLIQGTYVFQLVVTDDDNATNNDEVQVVVSAANIPPTVNAGADRNLILPTNSVNITGTATDNDGTITSVAWTQTSGTATTFTTSGNTISITNLVEGSYTYQFSATDEDGATSSDLVVVNVTASNMLPTVNAGSDRNITLPVNSLNITASASDADGTITSYLWTQLSGAAATLTNASSQTVSISNLAEGSYSFQVTVTDNEGGQAMDQVNVSVSSANTAPTVNAGPNKTIQLPTNTVILSGSASDTDGSIASYLWTKQSGPSVTLTNANTNSLTAQNLLEGTYIFRLTATDDDGASSFDEAIVFVNPVNVNQAPVANAGPDITLQLPTSSTNIAGSGSDADGTVVSYLWEQISGPNSAVLTNSSSATVTASGLIAGTYEFTLSITDDDGSTDSDNVLITVNEANANASPVANAGPDQNLVLPTNSISLTGSGSDSDGSITGYSWEKLSGPAATLSNQLTPTVILNNLVEGAYVFQLTVTDNEGAQDTDEVNITVLPESTNQSPTVNAGVDQQLILPDNDTAIQSSASDNDGTIVSYSWTKIAGGAATMSGTSTSKLILSALVEGTYTFRIIVEDDDGATATDDINITVLPENSNQPPTVSAGQDIIISLPQTSVDIFGTASDPDGTISSYLWEKISGPQATLSGGNQSSLMVSNLVEGNYQFGFTVTDDQGASSFDEMILEVLPESTNRPPTVTLGSNIFLDLPENSTVITSNASDPDGTIVAYEWQQLTGNTGISISGVNSSTLNLSNLVEGDYTFQLMVTDDGGLTATDDILVAVQPDASVPPESNLAPMADAGSDKEIILPVNTVKLIGQGFDDGIIVDSYWEQTSGNPVEFVEISKDTLNLINLNEGEYGFTYTVIDNWSVEGTDDVLVNVLPEAIIVRQSPGEKFFSPNGDGINDFWVLSEDPTEYETCSLRILDSRGKEIYFSRPYLNDWNGTFNGNPLEQGVYFYFVQCDDSSENVTGSITILR